MHPDDIGALLAELDSCGVRYETEYGVMRDRRADGLGILLDATTRSAAQAQGRAAQLRAQGGAVEIKRQLVITLPWEDTAAAKLPPRDGRPAVSAATCSSPPHARP